MRTNSRGFTLLELLIVIIIVGILASVAIPQFTTFVEKSQGAEALTNLGGMRVGLTAHFLENGSYPADFAALSTYGVDIVQSTGEWDFTFDSTTGLGTATRTGGPESGDTITMTVAGVLGGTWDYIP